MNIEQAELIAQALPLGQRNLDRMKSEISVIVGILSRYGLQSKEWEETESCSFSTGKYCWNYELMSDGLWGIKCEDTEKDISVLRLGTMWLGMDWCHETGEMPEPSLEYVVDLHNNMPLFANKMCTLFPELSGLVEPFLSAAQKQL